MSDSNTGFKPWTPEEIVDLVAPADPAISPDGEMVAFTVAPGGRKGEHPERTIWLSRQGEPATPFTSGLFNDHSPVWSPDSSKLLFLSDRKERGKDRLYLIDPRGGEAQPLGDLEGVLSSPCFSPDGASVAVIRTDPQTDEEKKKLEAKDDPIVVEEQGKFDRLWLIDIASGKARCLTYGNRHIHQVAWSRDARQLAIVWSDAPEVNARLIRNTLALIPASGGLARELGHFTRSPGELMFGRIDDEEMLAFTMDGDSTDPATSVWVRPLAGNQPARNLLASFPGQVETLVPVPDRPGEALVKIVEGTHGNLYRLDLASGVLKQASPDDMLSEGTVDSAFSCSADGGAMAFIWSDGDKARDVYVSAPLGEPVAVTTFGAAINHRLLPVEEVSWESDGIEIEGLLTLPAGYESGERYPLIVEVHGGPSWQWEDRPMLNWHDWAQLLASHGFAVLAPNPRGSTGRGSEFQKLLVNDVGGGEVRDLITGAEAMVERGIAHPDRLGIGGWSWGGYLTATTITQTTMFKSAVMGAGLANLISDHGTDDIPHANLLYFPGHPYEHPDPYWEGSAIRHVTKCTTPTLIVHGDADDRVPPSQGAEMYRALKILGVPVQFVRYPREPHAFKERAHQTDVQTRILDWFQRYL